MNAHHVMTEEEAKAARKTISHLLLHRVPMVHWLWIFMEVITVPIACIVFLPLQDATRPIFFTFCFGFPAIGILFSICEPKPLLPDPLACLDTDDLEKLVEIAGNCPGVAEWVSAAARQGLQFRRRDLWEAMAIEGVEARSAQEQQVRADLEALADKHHD